MARKKQSREDKVKEWRTDAIYHMRSRISKMATNTTETLQPDLTGRQVTGLFVPHHLVSHLDELAKYLEMPSASTCEFTFGTTRYYLSVNKMLLPKTTLFPKNFDGEVGASFIKYAEDVEYWGVAKDQLSFLADNLVREYGHANTLKILPELAVFGSGGFFDEEPKPIPTFSTPYMSPALRRLCRKARLDIATMAVLAGSGSKTQDPGWALSAMVNWQFTEVIEEVL